MRKLPSIAPYCEICVAIYIYRGETPEALGGEVKKMQRRRGQQKTALVLLFAWLLTFKPESVAGDKPHLPSSAGLTDTPALYGLEKIGITLEMRQRAMADGLYPKPIGLST